MTDVITIDAATRLLTELVQCPSVSPGTGPATGPPYGEAALAELLSEKVRALGGTVELREVEAGRPNFIGTFEGRDASRSLMLEAHGDTVAVEGMTVDPFAATVRDGKLYGRGACDTKGPMAAMLLAIEQVLAAEGQMPITVHFVSTCGEEVTGAGSKTLMAEGFAADAAIVGEPTGMEIIHASKGSGRFRIETRGRAAHSSTPNQGVNAIYSMAAVLEAIESEVAPQLARITHPLLGPCTISVGTIRGGSLVNVVPDRCTINIDTRLVPPQTPADVAGPIEAMLKALARSRDDFEYDLHQDPAYPPFCTDATDPLPTLLADVCRDVLGRSALSVAPWASNAAIFAAAGIPTVLFGPGSIAQAHTCDEFIEIAQVPAAARVYAEVISRYSSAAS